MSIVVPVFNEEGNTAHLADEIATAMGGLSHEMIFIDDASTDDTLASLHEAQHRHPTLRVVQHQQNAGQSRAIRTGVLAAKGKIIGILDGDGQNDPADLPVLLKVFQSTTPAPGMVAGRRTSRQDSLAKRMASKFGNGVRRALLRDGVRDTGCGLKVLGRHTYLNLPYFDHQHRFMAALVVREGLSVTTHPVSHRARQSGQSKYTNLGRLMVSIRDLLGMMWLRSRSRSPGTVTEATKTDTNNHQ